MTMKSTRTYALLEVGREAWEEVAQRVRLAGRGELVGADGEIDLDGIALVPEGSVGGEEARGIGAAQDDPTARGDAPGCGNVPCFLRIGPPRGMHTNGRCRCFDGVPTATRLKIQRALVARNRLIDELRRRYDADLEAKMRKLGG